MIIMFIGPSSSGKDYFYNKVLEKYNLETIVLYTTRPKRKGEVEGKEYHFIDKDTMDKLEKEKKLVERRDYDTVHGIWSYATRGDDIDKNKIYLVINTWEGYKDYVDYFGKNNIYPFYFDLDSNIRFERAFLREKEQKHKKYMELCRRFIADEKDFSKDKLNKYKPIIIDNSGSIEDTMKQIDINIKKIIDKSK